MRVGVIAAATVLTAAPGTSHAVLEEITVTARKIEESLQVTPVAVTAFSAAELEARGIGELDDVSRSTPNLTFFPSGIQGDASGQIYMRGVGQFDYFFNSDPGVGVYVDGVYLGRSLGSIIDLLDVDRIEVLRGPQGTLYGKNTIGGAINVITARPSEELSGMAMVKTGSYDRIDAQARVSGALIPGVLAGKLSLGTRNADGYGRRPNADDFSGNDEAKALRAQLAWNAAENLTVDFAADLSQINQELSAHHVEDFTGPPLIQLYNAIAGLGFLHGVPIQPYTDQYFVHDMLVDYGTGANYNKTANWGLSAIITWELGGVTIKSTTGYRNLTVDLAIDPDGSPERIIQEIDDQNQEQVSQELQLTGLLFEDKLSWVAGLYYFREKSDSDALVEVVPGLFLAFEGLPAPIIPLGPWPCPQPPGSPLPCAGGAGNPVNIGFDVPQRNVGQQTTNSYAAFAQGSWSFTDKLRGTYGVRFTRDHKDFSVESLRLRTPIPLLPLQEADRAWTDTSSRFGLDYQWNDDVLLYFSIAEGFKSGGFNGRARNAIEVQSFDPETITSFEMGLKSMWFDRRVRLNVAGFLNEYDDIQFTVQTAGPDPSTPQLIFTENAGDADVNGFEIELDAVPIDPLRITASAGYIDAQYKNISPEAQPNPAIGFRGITKDTDLIGTPKWTASVSVEYTFNVMDWGDLALRADYNYRAKTYFEFLNIESIAQPGYGLGNVRATFTTADEHWQIATGINNIANERYRASGVDVGDSLGFTLGWPGRPREWFLQGSYRF